MIMAIPSKLPICISGASPWQKKRGLSCSNSLATDYRSFLESLPHPVIQYPDDFRTKSSEKLQERIQGTLSRAGSCNPTATMELIDNIQRLGIGHYFEEEMKVQLERLLSVSSSSRDDHGDLFATSLRFRLLRHNGFPASTDVFKKFLNKKGKFEESLIEDRKGMLSLYEASYLGTKDEELLEQAKVFTASHLTQPLELPRHMRMTRLEAANYLNEYSKQSNSNLDVLKLAEFDSVKVRAQHQAELAEIIRWSKQLGFGDKLSFARNNPLDIFLGMVGLFPEPHQSSCRTELAKVGWFLFVIDDIFDAYGSLDDLLHFADAVNRWDLGAMEHLPEYMKIFYMALYNTTNDIAYGVLKKHGWNILPHLHRTWKDLVEAYLVEVRWCKREYVPTVEEYLVNGTITGGANLALVHSFFIMGQGVTNETVALLDPYPKPFMISSRILRLWDDLGTAKEEQERGGDVASCLECYMKEEGIKCEEEARRYLRQLIGKLWMELNGEMVAPKGLPPSAITASLNASRTAQTLYQQRDDHKLSSIEDQVQALLFRPLRIQD